MSTCQHQLDAERWFDGELAGSDAIEQHVAECSLCASHLDEIRRLRAGVEATREHVAITDAQLPGFLKGIEEGASRSRTSHVGLWAMASAIAAAIVVAVSLLSVFSSGPAPVTAETVFEEISTDIDGATAESFYLEDGTATLWINVPEGEMW